MLRQEGFLKVDRRHGAVIALDIDKIQAKEDMKEEMRVIIAKGRCKNISREEMHALMDELYDSYDS